MKRFNPFKRNFIPVTLACLAAIFFLSTGWERYQILPLKPVTMDLLPMLSQKDVGIAISAKTVSPNESKQYFGHDLISRGIQPLQLTIQNNTANEYSLCPSSVDLPRVEASKVAFKIIKSAIPRSIGYKIASFLFWPFMIPSTIDSIRTMSHHSFLKRDLKAKSIKEEVVAPYSTFHRVLYVPKDQYQSTFKVTLIDLETLKQEEHQVTAQSTEKVSEADTSLSQK